MSLYLWENQTSNSVRIFSNPYIPTLLSSDCPFQEFALCLLNNTNDNKIGLNLIETLRFMFSFDSTNVKV